MKKIIPLLVIFLLILILGAVYLFVDFEKENEETPEDTSAVSSQVVLSNTNASDIVSLTCSFEENHYTLQKENAVWKNAENPDIVLSQIYPEEMVTALASVTATRLVVENCENVAEYGLDDPLYTLSVEYRDGLILTYKISGKESFNGERYLMLEGVDSVYMIDSSFEETFSHSLASMVTVETPTVPTADTITDMNLLYGGETISLHYSEEEGKWYLMKDEKETEEITDLVSAFLNEMGTYSFAFENCVDFSANEEEKNSYFLGEEQVLQIALSYTEYVIVSSSEDGSSASVKVPKEGMFTWYYGKNPQAEDSFYVAFEDSNVVFSLSSASVSQFLNVLFANQ